MAARPFGDIGRRPPVEKTVECFCAGKSDSCNFAGEPPIRFEANRAGAFSVAQHAMKRILLCRTADTVVVDTLYDVANAFAGGLVTIEQAVQDVVAGNAFTRRHPDSLA